MSDLLDCRCPRWHGPCTAKADQEDLLCDPCREGCGYMVLSPADEPGAATSEWSYHLRASTVYFQVLGH